MEDISNYIDDKSVYSKISGTCSKIGLEIASYAIILMTVLVALNTATRALPFVRALTFVEEYSGYLFVVISFLGLADTLRQGAHVRVTLLTSRLRLKLRSTFELITTIAAIVIISILTWHAWNFFVANLQSGERASTVTMTPVWIPTLFLVPGYVFLLLELFNHLVLSFKTFRTANQQHF